MSLASQISDLATRVATEFKAVRAALITGPSAVGLTDATTVATNAQLGNVFRVTIAGNRTLGAPTNATDGQRLLWAVTASGADRTLTLATGSAGTFKFGSDITSVPVIASGTTMYIGAIYSSAAQRWHVIAVGSGY